jgi:chemotaxis signal transduction protein
MSESSAGFLRFEVCGQAFAISMTDLAGIRQVTEARAAEPDATPDIETHAYVAPVDTASLLFGTASSETDGFIVVVRAQQTMYVLRVDRVRAGTDMQAEERRDLPPLIEALDGPFNGMFYDPEGWGLIIDSNRMADLIRQQYAERATEHLYDLQ